MKRWKNWAGIFLSLTLAVGCAPEMSVHAGHLVSPEKSLIFGSTAGMTEAENFAAGQEGTESIFEIYVGNGQSIPQYQAGQKD